ncbi:STM4013/SEN3800 family hydrolase [Embleya sp. AB8]|uniref:STM4013/SEN3800 family hydrolase n=1 Tax=Embleya sp. AB8 TaxID=3156304 RepID=UPI003C78A865
MLDANRIIGTHHVLLITLDSLRFDVARAALAAGRTPNLAGLLGGGTWEDRRSAGTFTFPSHCAMFAGFLPSPSGPGRHPRLLACKSMPGAGTTITDRTYVFDAPNIVVGLANLGYATACVGGVGFFSGQTELGRVLPSLFTESYWSSEFAAAHLDSTEQQVACALGIVAERTRQRPLFLFLNVSATHVPHHAYLDGGPRHDTWESQLAALAYADAHLGRLFAGLRAHPPWLVVVCSDHGDAFGEDGHHGHGIAHPSVYSVPYLETVVPVPESRPVSDLPF